MLLIASDAVAPPARRSRTPLLRRHVFSSVALLVALVGLFVWVNLPAATVDLSAGLHLREAGLIAGWRKGELVVLVRHAERCDRSSTPCLGDASGITLAGSSVSAQVGAAFRQLGLAQTDVYTSPRARTVQTASSMFGEGVATQEWLVGCKTSLQRDMLAHKNAGRNLVLITHSGCINALEQALNASWAGYDSRYASALFVSVDSRSGEPRLLGFLNADDWAKVNREAAL